MISGEEEARYGYLAIANSTTLEDGAGIEIGRRQRAAHAHGGPPARATPCRFRSAPCA